jgi:HSP20 family protein
MSLFNNLNSSLPRESASACADDAACATTHSIPAIKPAYDVQETAEAYQLTVQLPGVAKDGLELTAETDGLRLIGRRTWTQPAGWTALQRESADASYELVLTHDNAVAADKIVAELRDGVLHATLPKHEALKPRKIAVT